MSATPKQESTAPRAAAQRNRVKYVMIACGLALLIGVGILSSRMAWQQYKAAQRQQIIATAPDAFEQGTQWGSDPDSSFEKLKQRLTSSHPAYALGVAAIGVKDAHNDRNQLRCSGDSIVVTAVMATCNIPTGQLTALGSYIANFFDHPPAPTQFNAAGIPLWGNGVPDLHPGGVSPGHYLGFTLADTGSHYAEDAGFLLKLLTDRPLNEIPPNGIWTPANGITMDARNCYAAQQHNSLSVMCFWEG